MDRYRDSTLRNNNGRRLEIATRNNIYYVYVILLLSCGKSGKPFWMVGWALIDVGFLQCDRTSQFGFVESTCLHGQLMVLWYLTENKNNDTNIKLYNGDQRNMIS